MKSTIWLEETQKFDNELEEMMLSYKNPYQNDAHNQEIFKICRKISRASIPDAISSKERAKEEILRPFFLRSLKVLENPYVIDYFTEKTKKIRLMRSSNDQIEIYYEGRDKKKYKINLPNFKLTMSEQMGYAHEVGHIPEIEKTRKNFLEYSEALPIFMEYLIQLRRFKNRQDALDNFLLERLPIEQEEARSIMKIYKNLNNKNKLARIYYSQTFADNYKYLESLEYVLQLIDRMGDDLRAVGDEIEAITDGKSLIETADSLDIVTDGCPRLLKEYKRMSR